MNRATTVLAALCAALAASAAAQRLEPTPAEIQNRLAALEVINVTSAKAPDPAARETDPEVLAILAEADAAAAPEAKAKTRQAKDATAAKTVQMTPRGSSPTKN